MKFKAWETKHKSWHDEHPGELPRGTKDVEASDAEAAARCFVELDNRDVHYDAETTEVTVRDEAGVVTNWEVCSHVEITYSAERQDNE